MHFGTPNGALSVDFADVLLIVNVAAIALLLGLLYLDEIVAEAKRAAAALKPQALLQRLRCWFKTVRTSH